MLIIVRRFENAEQSYKDDVEVMQFGFCNAATSLLFWRRYKRDEANVVVMKPGVAMQHRSLSFGEVTEQSEG